MCDTPNRSYAFIDEAGCMTFARKKGASTYFIVCSITLESCQIGNDLLGLRRELAWQGYDLGDYFHATTDKQAVRDEVFKVIAGEPFKVHSTILEKPKAQDHLRKSRERFYKTAFYFHFQHVGPLISQPTDELLITTASIGTKRERAAFVHAVEDVMSQTVNRSQWATTFCEAKSDPCLQVVDYCAWAIQRKWEAKDNRSYELIAHKIASEYDLWAKGSTLYY